MGVNIIDQWPFCFREECKKKRVDKYCLLPYLGGGSARVMRKSYCFLGVKNGLNMTTNTLNFYIFRKKDRARGWTPPSGNPLSKNIFPTIFFSVYFALYALKNIFGFHQKVNILPISLHLHFGIGDPPPPHTHISQIPKTPFFFPK